MFLNEFRALRGAKARPDPEISAYADRYTLSMSFAFLDCVLDESCFELRRRGKSVRLEPKVFDVLLHLIANRDRVVTKNELLDTLWPGEAVSDSVLPRCIAAMRRAVGDSRTRQQVIATAHGRGYRFVAELKAAGAPTPKTPAPSTPAPAAQDDPTRERSKLIGRVGPMARLTETLDRTASGRGGVTLIVGEPGIGKTRLCEELETHARERGFEVQVGHCYEGEGAPAYWPWVQILRDAANQTESDTTLRAQLGMGAAELAEVVPELRARFPELEAAGGPGGEQARFRLFEAAARFLEQRADSMPLVLILEDLHWGDASSLGLLAYLARPAASSRILLVGTYRDVDVRRGLPLADLLGTLARQEACERIALSGLDDDEIADLVRLFTGQSPRADLVATLREMTEGNPFFLLEMVQLIAEKSSAAEAGPETLQALTLPQGVKDAIGRRLDALSPECNAMLRSASVIGRRFGIQRLEAMLDYPEEERSEATLELVAEALDAGAIVEAEHGAYAFSHALTRQTLYEELRSPARIALHRRAGLALEQSLDPALGREEHAAELAHHFFEAAPGGDVDKAVDCLAEAAVAADRKYAYDEAVLFHERALEALELRVPQDEERRSQALLSLGEAQFIAGRRDDAIGTLRSAAALSRTVGRVDLLARSAIALRGHGELGSPPPEGVFELLQEALEKLPEKELALRARLTARLNGGRAQTMSGRMELAERSLELAKASEDPVALRDALGAKWWATLGPDAVEERGVVGDALRQLAEQMGDPRTLLLALETEISSGLIRGDREATERGIDAFDRVAAQIRQPVFTFMGMQYRISWLIDRGRFEEAEARLEEATEFGLGLVPYADAACKGLLYFLRGSQGVGIQHLTGAEDVSGLMSESFIQPALARVFLAMFYFSTDRDPRRSCELIRQIDYPSMERDEHWLLAATGIAEIAAAARDREISGWAYQALLPYADLIGIDDLLRASRSSVASSLAASAACLGKLDDAVAHYEKAIAKEEAADLITAVTTSRLGLARVLRERGGPGDIERAEGLIERAAETIRELALGPESREHRLLGALGEQEKLS